MAGAAHADYLDGWRGAAIILLLIGHFFPVPGLNLGRVGVDFFFVLSGLLMTRLLFIQHTPLALFYRRRIARIAPALALFMVIMLAALLAGGKPILWHEVLGAATFTNNYFLPGLGPDAMPFGHIWSLSVEEHSYIALSLVAFLARRKIAAAPPLIGALLLAMVTCSIGYAITLAPLASSNASLRTEVAAFGIFASGALLLFLQGRSLPRLPTLAFAALVAGAVLLSWWKVPMPIRIVLGTGLLVIAVNLLPAAPALVQRALSARWLRQMGLWSFSLYLWQQPFYLLSKHHGLPVVAGLGLAMACGLASFYLVEQPARRWLNSRWSPAPATGTRPEPVRP